MQLSALGRLVEKKAQGMVEKLRASSKLTPSLLREIEAADSLQQLDDLVMRDRVPASAAQPLAVCSLQDQHV